VFAALCFLHAAKGVKRNLCILPVGDSITQTHACYEGWRYKLWRRLLDGYGDTVEVGFAGSMSARYSSRKKPSLKGCSRVELPEHAGKKFPPYHEGHWGWTTTQVLGNTKNLGPRGRGNLAEWLKGYDSASNRCKPVNCALVHLGTNDARRDGKSADAMVTDLRVVVRKLQAKFSQLMVIVAVPIPTCTFPRKRSLHTAYGKAIKAAFNNSVGTSVVEFSDFSSTTDVYDGCHPNNDGNAKMAAAFFDAISNHCVPRLEIAHGGEKLTFTEAVSSRGKVSPSSPFVTPLGENNAAHSIATSRSGTSTRLVRASTRSGLSAPALVGISVFGMVLLFGSVWVTRHRKSSATPNVGGGGPMRSQIGRAAPLE